MPSAEAEQQQLLERSQFDQEAVEQVAVACGRGLGHLSERRARAVDEAAEVGVGAHRGGRLALASGEGGVAGAGGVRNRGSGHRSRKVRTLHAKDVERTVSRARLANTIGEYASPRHAPVRGEAFSQLLDEFGCARQVACVDRGDRIRRKRRMRAALQGPGEPLQRKRREIAVERAQVARRKAAFRQHRFARRSGRVGLRGDLGQVRDRRDRREDQHKDHAGAQAGRLASGASAA